MGTMANTQPHMSTVYDGPRASCGGKTNIGTVERAASAAGGLLLSAIGLKRRGMAGAAMTRMGGELIRRAVTGHSLAYEAFGVDTAHGPAVHVRHSVRIHASRERVYAFLRRRRNLPSILRHVDSVTELPDGRSHWRMKPAGGPPLECDARMDRDEPNRWIAWSAESGCGVPNKGSIHLCESPDHRSTEVHLWVEYPGDVGDPQILETKRELRRLDEFLDESDGAL